MINSEDFRNNNLNNLNQDDSEFFGMDEFSNENNNNKINDIGGVEYIADLLSMVPNAANVDSYIQIVEDNYMLRNVIDTSAEISTLAYEHDGEVSEILDQVESKIVGIIKADEEAAGCGRQ